MTEADARALLLAFLGAIAREENGAEE